MHDIVCQQPLQLCGFVMQSAGYAAGSEWLAVLKYATVAVQGSAVAQANLAWLLERSSEYEAQQRVQMCMRLLSQAGKGGLPDAWVDAGNLKYYTPQKGALHAKQSMNMHAY